ncbi:hypothetical protein CLV92_11119 [Kineococcus xinjiangensis]|uniref:DUF3040 family protein n=1 Tax=Kineococcus xinjiangensis TaxID=512762 RepID=A0A2S6IFX1_9ACTN|nr:hypothetical protein [Kineococcus xinjiangensis]PPK93103.1 hypothetical protein CLV92_11119 [Kineococcus xinjiangensis]
MALVGPAMDRERRINAARAFHALAPEDRREALALARRGRRHPDERVAVVAWWYAAATLQPTWWNKVPPVVLPAAGIVLVVLAFWWDSWPLALVALLLVLAGGVAWWQRAMSEPLLALGMRPVEDGDRPAGGGAAQA